MVSHNLRSPAAGLKMLFDLYAKMETPEQKEEIVASLKEGGEQLFSMIDDLAKVLMDYPELLNQTTSIKLEEALKPILKEAEQELMKIEGSVSFDFSACPEVQYHEVYLQSIFQELISNAIKYRSANRPLELSISSHANEGKAILTFKDNGLGMDLSEHGDRLFKMYKTYHPELPQNGKGTGLFSVKNKVEIMGGKFSVHSQPDVGTIFALELNSD